MGKLSADDIKHVAQLAQLDLTAKEISKFRKQLSEVVSYVDELKEVNVKGVAPTSQTTNLENIHKKDVIEVDQALTEKEALSGTEKVHNNYFKVPGVIDPRTE